MSQSLYHRVSIIDEGATLGTTPATPAMLSVAIASTSPQINAPKTQSREMRTDGRIKQSFALNRSAGFQRTQELVYPTVNEALWTEIRAGLRTTETAQTSGVSITLSAAGDSTVDRASGSFIDDGFQPGDVVNITGAATASHNGPATINTVSALQLDLLLPDGAVFASNEAATITRGARMVDGLTNRSFSIEEVWTDTQKMVGWTGQRVAGVDLGFAMGSGSTVSVSYAGKDGTPANMDSATQGFAGATYTAYTESPIMGPTEAIEAIVNNESLPVQSMRFAFSSGARTRFSVEGGGTPDAIPTGTFRCTVSVTAYASVLSVLTQYRNGTEVPVWAWLPDSDGKAIAVSLGTVVWDSATLPSPGLDSDAIITASGTATLTEAVDANDQDWVVRFLRFE